MPGLNVIQHFPPTFGKVGKLLFLLRDSLYTDGEEDLMEFLKRQIVPNQPSQRRKCLTLKSYGEFLPRFSTQGRAGLVA